MTHWLVVTEGLLDQVLVARILEPERVEQRVRVTHARGRSAAVSLARTMAGIQGEPTVLVLDTDSVATDAVADALSFAASSLREVAPPSRFRIVSAVPDTTGALFEAGIVDDWRGTPLDVTTSDLAKQSPQAALRIIASLEGEPLIARIRDLDRGQVSRLRQTTLGRQLVHAVTAGAAAT